MGPHLGQEVVGPPDEDSGIPEIAVAHHPLGYRALRLLDEPRHAARAGVHGLAGLDVTEPGVRPGWNDAYRDEAPVTEGEVRRFAERTAEFALVADRPVRVNADHDAVGLAAALDLGGCPCKSRC